MKSNPNDFADILYINSEDIKAYAQDNTTPVLQIGVFKSLYLKKERLPQNCEENSFDSEEVTYFLYLHTSLGKAIIGEFNLFRVDNLVEFNGYRPQNCWERISKMFPGPDNISFGKLGYTRAVLKTLT